MKQWLVWLLGVGLFVALPLVVIAIGDRTLNHGSRGIGLIIFLGAPIIAGAVSGYLIRSWRFVAVTTLLLFMGYAYAIITSNLVVLVLLLYLPALLGAAIGTALGQSRAEPE